MKLGTTAVPGLLAALALAGCGDAVRPGELRPEEIARADVRGGGQAGRVGERLADSVVVRVERRGGGPAADLTLEWRVLTEGGGEARFPTTRTDAAGRSANVWLLGPRAGEHRLELRAVLPAGAVVLDTVMAAAAPGPVASVEVVGDTVRMLALGDTLRLAARALDRYDNPVPGVAPQWSAGPGGAVVVEAGGRVRGAGFGAGIAEARAAGRSARVHLRVSARVEVFPVAGVSTAWAQVGPIVGNGGRLLALASGRVYAFDGSAWAARPEIVDAAAGSLHVTPSGWAFAGTSRGGFNSRPGSEWTPYAPLAGTRSVGGAGETVFAATSPAAGPPSVYRLDGERLVDLGFPTRYAASWRTQLVAGGPADLYVFARDSAYRDELLHWDGAGWKVVRAPDGAGPLAFWRFAAHPDGGPAWGSFYDPGPLYRVEDGVAERVELPAGARGEHVVSLAVSAAGEPYVLLAERVVYRTAAGWRAVPVPGEWTPSGIWPAVEGVVWLGATRPAGVDAAGRQTYELAFLRITAAS